MSELTRERRLEILAILGATECACGKPKKARMSHCPPCYFALPPPMRQALYQGFGSGYEEAYEASREFLRQRAA